MRQLDEHQQPAGQLDQFAHGTRLGLVFGGVALPMPAELPVFNLRWTRIDAEHVAHLASSVLAFAARCSFVGGSAHTGDQFPAQLCDGLGLDALVDRIV